MIQDEAAQRAAAGTDAANERRAEILQATIKTIAEAGITGATMKRVAEEAGVSPALLFHYYRNKKELITAAMAASSIGLHHRVDEAVNYGFGLERIRSMYELVLTNSDGKQAPAAFWIELISECLRDEDIREHELMGIDSSRGYLRRSVELLKETGKIDLGLETELLIDLLVAIGWGLRLRSAVDSNMPPERSLKVASLVLELIVPNQARSDAEAAD